MLRFLLIALLLVSCAKPPRDMKALTEYPTLVGKIVGEPVPEAGNKRLFIYLRVESEVEQSSEVFVCLAVNTERKDILIDLKARLMEGINEPVFIFGFPNESRHYEEIIQGVDFHVVAVGFWVPQTEKYSYRIANYSKTTREALRSMEWGNFLKRIGKLAVDKAL